MICRKCGQKISDGSTFCAHCGCDLRKSSSNHNQDEQVPLLLLIKQIKKHKIAVIISLVLICFAIGGYIAMQKHQEKKQAQEAFAKELKHIVDICGTYENRNFKILISADNTALVTYKGDWREKTSRGYWREKFDGQIIEIELSKSLEDIYVGSEKRYSCSTLYLVGNTLWESMSALRSHDYSACENLSKE